MLHIVTDGTADFPPGWIEKYQVHIVPFRIHFGEETYLQGVDLSDDDFYRLIEERHIIPKTSQASPQQLEDTYTRIAQPGDTVLSIHVSSKLSGTFESAVIAARKLEGQIRVIPFDSKAGAAALAFMCKEAREMDWEGFAVEDILKRLETIRENTRIVLSMDNLNYARMSGRVKATQALLASALRLKPIIELEDGALIAKGKVRTRARALAHVVQRIKEEFGEQLVDVAVVHARAPKEAEQLEALTRQALNIRTLITTTLSTAVTVHLGPGTLGLVAYPVEGSHASVG
ncbi:MAG: DegV family protein [Chloroflexi bacterium]|nr:DegV family protein [Chloroflexota bacterium]